MKLKNKKILLVSHELSLTGAPNAVLQTAKIYREAGAEVKILAFAGGDLETEVKKEKIEYDIVPEAKELSFQIWSLIRDYDLVFINSVLSANFVYKVLPYKPLIWRVSEVIVLGSTFFVNPILQETLKKTQNLITVGEYAQEFLLKYNSDPKIIHFGIPDLAFKYPLQQSYSDDLNFVFVGSLSERKEIGRAHV